MSCAAAAQALTLGVHPEEPAPEMAAVLAEQQSTELAIELQQFSDQAELIAALQAGTVDAGLVSAPQAPMAGVRLITDLYPSVLHVLHRTDLAGRSLDELLTSGPIWAGGAGSAGERLLQALIADYGLSPDQVTVLENPFSQSPAVLIVFGGILTNDALSRLDGYALFAFDRSVQSAGSGAADGDLAQGIVLRHPTLHTITLPAQLYPTLANARVTTVAVDTQLVVRDSLAVSEAYALAELALQARPVMAARYPFVALEGARDRASMAHALPMHDGAVRFLDRHEPSFLERYAEVFAFLLTMLVAIASATVAFNRYRRQRRKDRLDRFFEKLLQQRAELVDAPSAAAASVSIRALQSEVVALVVEERINADGALLAFLSLSNQLLAECEQQRSAA
ncbi:MAG: TAXI family TRAP transporter solute-binding subunit [Pseudomonadales bacterium]